MSTPIKASDARLTELRRHQVYRLERPQRPLLTRLRRSLRARLHR